MPYSVSLLKTAAECDSVLQLATREKKNLEVKKIVLTNSLDNMSINSAELATELAIVNGDIATYQAVIATLAEGKRKTDYEDKLTTAEYKLHLLNKRAGKNGGESLLDYEVDLADIEASITHRTALFDAVTTHKATLA